MNRTEQFKHSQPAEPVSERTDGGWCLTSEELGATSDQSPPFPWMCLAIFNGKWDLISTQGKWRTVLSLKTQPAGNFVVPLGPMHGKLLDCRDFSEERLFHRKMLLCWNPKHSTGMCWFVSAGNQANMKTVEPVRVHGSWPAQPGAPRAYRSNNVCEPPN